MFQCSGCGQTQLSWAKKVNMQTTEKEYLLSDGKQGGQNLKKSVSHSF
jgi:hypothetical protein